MEELCDGLGAVLDVVHLDGHADLGLGDPSWVHLVTEWLARPPSERRNPPRAFGTCNPGSYLAYAAAGRLLGSVLYAFPPGGGKDFHAIHFLDNDPGSGFLQMKRFRRPVDGFDYGRLTAAVALGVEPSIPFAALPIDQFETGRPFDFAFVCQSPGFTPRKSDELLPVLAEYIEFDERSETLPRPR